MAQRKRWERVREHGEWVSGVRKDTCHVCNAKGVVGTYLSYRGKSFCCDKCLERHKRNMINVSRYESVSFSSLIGCDLCWAMAMGYHSGRNIPRHRIIAARGFGIVLGRGRVVHHRNMDEMDNRLENLEVLTHSEHKRVHLYVDSFVKWHGSRC